MKTRKDRRPRQVLPRAANRADLARIPTHGAYCARRTAARPGARRLTRSSTAKLPGFARPFCGFN